MRQNQRRTLISRFSYSVKMIPEAFSLCDLWRHHYVWCAFLVDFVFKSYWRKGQPKIRFYVAWFRKITTEMCGAYSNVQPWDTHFSPVKDLHPCLIAQIELNIPQICRSNFEMFTLSQALFPKWEAVWVAAMTLPSIKQKHDYSVNKHCLRVSLRSQGHAEVTLSCSS